MCQRRGEYTPNSPSFDKGQQRPASFLRVEQGELLLLEALRGSSVLSGRCRRRCDRELIARPHSVVAILMDHEPFDSRFISTMRPLQRSSRRWGREQRV